MLLKFTHDQTPIVFALHMPTSHKIPNIELELNLRHLVLVENSNFPMRKKFATEKVPLKRLLLNREFALYPCSSFQKGYQVVKSFFTIILLSTLWHFRFGPITRPIFPVIKLTLYVATKRGKKPFSTTFSAEKNIIRILCQTTRQIFGLNKMNLSQHPWVFFSFDQENEEKSQHKNW